MVCASRWLPTAPTAACAARALAYAAAPVLLLLPAAGAASFGLPADVMLRAVGSAAIWDLLGGLVPRAPLLHAVYLYGLRAHVSNTSVCLFGTGV